MKSKSNEVPPGGASPPAGVDPGDAGNPSASYPTRRAGVRARAVDGEMLLLNRERRLVHQLNATAKYIWDRCDGRHTLASISDELAQAFDVDGTTVTAHVAATVTELEAAGLVEMRAEQLLNA